MGRVLGVQTVPNNKGEISVDSDWRLIEKPSPSQPLIAGGCSGCRSSRSFITVALVGNPNTGKSTVFNALTGLRQHTGNWAGKTVGLYRGSFYYKNHRFILVDLPGTYSLRPVSPEEKIARDFLFSGEAEVAVVVVDATALERSLPLALQVMELGQAMVLCVNLVDEARKLGLEIDVDGLARELGIPVVATAARSGEGLKELREAIYEVATGIRKINPHPVRYDEEIEGMAEKIIPLLGEMEKGDKRRARWMALKVLAGEFPTCGNKELEKFLKPYKELEQQTFQERMVCQMYEKAQDISGKTLRRTRKVALDRGRWLDHVVTSQWAGFPLMLLLLTVVLWLTLVGANYPSEILAHLFFALEEKLMEWSQCWGLPGWLIGLAIQGAYRTTAWVVSVMLPPMAIFFPCFTFLEDLGYLPRVAFNLDGLFKLAGTQGKQALTMAMGFGCNAAGIMACRIIDSPRERLIAMLTNVSIPKLQPDLCRVVTVNC